MIEKIMSKNKKWRKFFHKRYVVWLFWHNICKLSSAIRKKANFYEEFIEAGQVPHELYKKENRNHNLKEIDCPISEDEKELIEKSFCKTFENVVENVSRKISLLKYKDVLLIGKTGNLIYNEKIIISDINESFILGHQYFKSNFSTPIKKSEDELFFSTVGIDKGHKHFYHFFIDFLPRIFYLLEALPKTSITIITNSDLASYQKFAYDYVVKKYPNIKIIQMPKNEIWELPNAVFLYHNCNVHPSFVDKGYLHFLREIFVKGQGVEEKDNIHGNRYYISRNDTKNRNVINEDELKPILEEYGFKIVYPTHFSHKDQIEMFANAEAIVAPAGAALTNLLFVRPETKVVGFYPSDLLSSCHMWTCKGVGIKYHKHIITGAREGSRGHYRIEKEQLINALEDMFK